MQDIPGWTGCPVLHKRLGLHAQAQCWNSKSPGSLLVPAQPADSDSMVLDMKTSDSAAKRKCLQSSHLPGTDPQTPAAAKSLDSDAAEAPGSDTTDVAFTSSFVGCCPLLGVA